MKKAKIFLVDANSYLYRAYFAIPKLITSRGMPTGAIYGFTIFFSRLIKEQAPDYLVFCFDSKKPTHRTKMFAQYKAHRPKMPDDLKIQSERIGDVLDAFGLKSIKYDGFEADDIIATLAMEFKGRGLSVYIVTGDKDMCQLVNENIKIYNPQKEVTVLDTKAVKDKFGVGPEKIVDLLALAGDKADNIPGASGIGGKTAVKLIAEFGSVDELLANLDKVSSSGLRERLEKSRQDILLSRDLVCLNYDVPLKVDLTELRVGEPDREKLINVFKEFEFKSMLKDLDKGKPNDFDSKRAMRKEAKLPDKLIGEAKAKKELLLYWDEFRDFLVLGTSSYFCEVKEINNKIRDVLLDPKIKKISHDLKAVKVELFKKDIDIQGLYLDFRLAFYLWDSGRSDYSLAALSLDYLNKIVDSQHLLCAQTFSLMDDLRFIEKELAKKNMQSLFFDIEMPLLNVLADLETCGVKIDKDFLGKLSRRLDKEIATLRKEIFSLSRREFNINSPKQLSHVLFEELKLPVKKRRKSYPSTDEEVLRSLSADFPITGYLLNYRQLVKLKTTYIDVLPTLIDRKDKIHTSFNQTGTQTGRLSSSDPNLQNIPIKTEIGAQIRRAFIASKANGLLLSADYSQIELRILAHLAGEGNLIEAFKNDLDIHIYTASLIFGVRDSEVDDSMRNVAKRVNFGIIYGISSFGLAKDLKVSLETANEFIENYFLRYPKVKDFMLSCIEQARREGYVSTILGRRRHLPAVNSKNLQLRSFAERQAINMPVQGSAADLIKKAMLDIYGEFKQRGFRSQMVLQVHDELIFDCESKEVSEIIPLVKERMENAFKLTVPIKVSIKQGKNWLEMEEV